MQVTTIRNRPKQFSFSYSKLKNFETCPSRYYHVDVTKKFKEEEGEALAFGNSLHKALAERLSPDKIALPKAFEEYEGWCTKLEATPGVIYTEQQLAITKDFEPCDWKDWNKAWYRGIADVIKINGPVALAWDWKTGKVLENHDQLALMAQCVFSHYPQVKRIRAEFIWLREDATTRIDIARDDMVKFWVGMEPRIATLEHAHNTTSFPATPTGICKRWCPVTACPHHGV